MDDQVDQGDQDEKGDQGERGDHGEKGDHGKHGDDGVRMLTGVFVGTELASSGDNAFLWLEMVGNRNAQRLFFFSKSITRLY